MASQVFVIDLTFGDMDGDNDPPLSMRKSAILTTASALADDASSCPTIEQAVSDISFPLKPRTQDL